MAALLLTVESDRSAWHGNYAADVETVRRTGLLRTSWAVDRPPAPDAGSDVWLLATRSEGTESGLIGHGILAGTVDEEPVSGSASRMVGRCSSFDDNGRRPASYLLIDVDLLLPRGDEIPADVGSGDSVQVLSAHAALALRSLCSAHLAPDPGSVAPVPGVLPAAALRYRADNRFEVDTDLRRTALAHRGSVCHACGLDGQQTYGDAGADIVQVHLITPLTLIDEEFEPDPLVDLVPLCPTCHVLVHGGTPDAYSVGDVRAMIRAGGHLRGSVLTPHQLEAEEAAARILEAGG